MRHILVHGYYQIKDEIIWATIETELDTAKIKTSKAYRIIKLLTTACISHCWQRVCVG